VETKSSTEWGLDDKAVTVLNKAGEVYHVAKQGVARGGAQSVCDGVYAQGQALLIGGRRPRKTDKGKQTGGVWERKDKLRGSNGDLFDNSKRGDEKKENV